MDWVEPAGLQVSAAANAMGDRLEVHTDRLPDGIRMLSVTGTLDLLTAPRFEDQLLTALLDSQADVIVDLTECDFLDVAALGVIVRRNRLLTGRGPRVLFVAPQRSLLRVFALAHLDGLLEIHPTRSAALSSSLTLRNPREEASMDDPTHVPAADGDRYSSQVAQLARNVQERLAHVEAKPPDGLIAGTWGPRDGVCVIALVGEMDMSNANEITKALDGHLDHGPCRLVIELSRLTFIDSSGIKELVKLVRAVEGSGGEMVLSGPIPHVARVFEITNLGDLIAVEDSLEAALKRNSSEDSSPVASAGTESSTQEEGTSAEGTA